MVKLAITGHDDFGHCKQMSRRPPFFIVGCVRSGTTLLRDLLRGESDLICPEETHIYRWSEPFRTRTFSAQAGNNVVIKKHREIDGISEEEFALMLKNSTSRRDLMWRYFNTYARKSAKPDANWFDKTPQNIYGLPLLIHDFPHARFIHMVRHPYNVAASLVVGKVVAAPDIVAAANYWNEAVAIFNTLKPLIARRSFELSYEKLTADPVATYEELRRFLGCEGEATGGVPGRVHAEREQHKTVLNDEQRSVIDAICGKWARHYGYAVGPEHAVAPASRAVQAE